MQVVKRESGGDPLRRRRRPEGAEPAHALARLVSLVLRPAQVAVGGGAFALEAHHGKALSAGLAADATFFHGSLPGMIVYLVVQ
jgi:hypothetical protein